MLRRLWRWLTRRDDQTGEASGPGEFGRLFDGRPRALPKGGSGARWPAGLKPVLAQSEYLAVPMPGTLTTPTITLRVPVVDALPATPAPADLVFHEGRVKLWTGAEWCEV